MQLLRDLDPHFNRKEVIRAQILYKRMIDKCHNKSTKGYREFGLKGYTVSKRWLVSFEKFLKDMGPPPSVEHNLKIKPGKREFNKANCSWCLERY